MSMSLKSIFGLNVYNTLYFYLLCVSVVLYDLCD